MIITDVKKGRLLVLGNQNEGGHKAFRFDISDLAARYGSGHAAIVARRHGESQSYPCSTTSTAQGLVWSLTTADTAKAGLGSCELRYTVGQQIVTQYWITYTRQGTATSTTSPDPYSDWAQEINSQLDSLSDQMGDISDTADENSGLITTLSGSVSTINGQITTVNSRLTTLEGRANTLDGQVSTVNGQISTISGNVNTVSGQVSTLSGTVDSLSDSVDGHTSQISTHTTQITTVNSRLTTLEGRANTLDGQVSTINGQITTINGQLTTLDGQIDDLTQQVEDMEFTVGNGLNLQNGVLSVDTSILPTVPTVDTQPVSGSSNPISSGAVYTLLGTLETRLGSI